MTLEFGTQILHKSENLHNQTIFKQNLHAVNDTKYSLFAQFVKLYGYSDQCHKYCLRSSHDISNQMIHVIHVLKNDITDQVTPSMHSYESTRSEQVQDYFFVKT